VAAPLKVEKERDNVVVVPIGSTYSTSNNNSSTTTNNNTSNNNNDDVSGNKFKGFPANIFQPEKISVNPLKLGSHSTN